jgi:phosphoglycerate dehydrogenase-like enzyme
MTRRRPRVCITIALEDRLNQEVDATCEAIHVSLPRPREELLAALGDIEGLLLLNREPVGVDVFDAAPRLRVVSGIGVGYDKFDVSEATKRGVAICNTPDVVTPPVADLTLAAIVMLSRRLFENDGFCREGRWGGRESRPPMGTDVKGKTLGVVGFGRIGKEVTRRARVFGMRTVFNDVFEVAPAGAPESTYRPLDNLLRESDVVSLHPDLNPTSYHLIGRRELALMKPTAFLINTSRGPVVDQDALTDVLKRGAIAGAALDVLEKEPPDPGDPIVALPNVLTFPHIGTFTTETRAAMREFAVRNLLAVLRGERPLACVNPSVLAQ